MAQYQGRKAGLAARKKKKSELGADPRNPKLADSGEEERKQLRKVGGSKKTALVKALYANISVKGKTKKVKITMVLDNPANKDFRRENILSLGGVVETEMGKARITSRPSQDGVVNAVLLE